jgi:hypothetical protein
MSSFLSWLSTKAALFSLGLTFATISPLALTVAVNKLPNKQWWVTDCRPNPPYKLKISDWEIF